MKIGYDEILKQICYKINEIQEGDSNVSKDTILLGDNGMLGSLSVIVLVEWCFQTYNVDLIDNDINLSHLETVETLVNYIFDELYN